MTELSSAQQQGNTGFFHELRTGAWRQASVIFAMIFKELKGRLESQSHGGVIWVVLDPIQHVIVLATLWYLIGRTKIDGVHVALFLAVGMVPYTFVRMCMSSIPAAVRTNRSFFNFQQVKPIDAIIARFALNISLAILGLAVMFFLIGWFLGEYISIDHFLEVMALFTLALAMGFGIALLVATYGTMYDIILKVLAFISRPMLFLSSVLHPAGDLPAAARYWLSWNPLVHIIEYMRHYSLGTKVFPEAQIAWPVEFTLGVLFLGFTAYYANRTRLIQIR